MIDLFCAVQAWFINRYKSDQRGASLVEYALLVALIAVVCIVAIGVLGTNARDKFSEVGTSIGNAGG